MPVLCRYMLDFVILSSKYKYIKFSLNKSSLKNSPSLLLSGTKGCSLSKSVFIWTQFAYKQESRHCFLSSSVSLENGLIDICLKGKCSLANLWWRCWKGKPVNIWAQTSPPGTSKGIGLYFAGVFFYPLVYWKSRGRPLNICESSIVLSEVGKRREMESRLPRALLCFHWLLCGRVNRRKEKTKPLKPHLVSVPGSPHLQ